MRIKAAALAILALTTSNAALAAGNPWKITEAAGQVQVRHGPARTEAARGRILEPRDVVETGANGRAVIARGSDVVFISPRTRLTIAPPEQSRGLIQIIQDLGRATFMIERKANPHFAVETPYLATVVKGTVFTIIVGEAGASVSVREGRVEVSTPRNEARQMVVTGMTASVTAASPGRIDLRSGPDHDPAASVSPIDAADRTSDVSADRAPTLDYVLAFMAEDEDEAPVVDGDFSARLDGPDSAVPGGDMFEPVLASAIAPLIPALPSAPVPAPAVLTPVAPAPVPPPPAATPVPVSPPPAPAPAPVPVPPPPPPPAPAPVPAPPPPPPPPPAPAPPPPPAPVPPPPPAPAPVPPPPPPAPVPPPPPAPAPVPPPPPPPAPAPVPPPPPAPVPPPPPPPAPAPVPPPPPPPPPPGGICVLGLICLGPLG